MALSGFRDNMMMMLTTKMMKRREGGWVSSVTFALLVLMTVVVDQVHSFKEPPVIQSGSDLNFHHQRYNNNKNRRIIIKTGEPLKLVCPVEQHLDTIIDWVKNGQNIHMGWERYKMNEAVLRVKETVLDDSGVYACKATNGFGSVVVKFHVYVYSNESRTTPDPQEVERFFRDIGGAIEDPDIKPFITDLQNYTVNVGDSVTWFCDVYSNEEPKIQWFKKIDESNRGHQHYSGQKKNDTIYIGGSQYLPVSMDTGLTPASLATDQLQHQQQKAALYSSKLELQSVDYDNQGMYLCAVFTPSYFDYKTSFVKITGSSDLSGQPRRRITNQEPETSRDDMTYVILIVILSMVALVVIIVVLVVRRLRANRVSRTRSSITAQSNKKGCIRVPQQAPPHHPPMMMQSGPQINHPYLVNQYQPAAYPSSSLTSSPLPQNYPQSIPQNIPQHSISYPLGHDDSFPNSTLPSNVHLQSVPYIGNAYQQLAQQQQQQPKLTTQQLKLFQQQQQQQQMVALYDCGEC